MFLVEIKVQGARGFSRAARVVLRPGPAQVVLQPPMGSAPPLGALLAALCYSDGRGGDASFLAPGEKTGAASITLIGNDRVTYRVARTLGGGGSLERIEAGTATVISSDATEIGQFLRAQVGLPTRAALAGVFTLSPSQLPSRGPKTSGGGQPSAPAVPTSPALSAADLEHTQHQLDELKKELELSKEVDVVQRRADEISNELYELETQVKGGEALKAAIVEAKRAEAEAPTPERLGLPPDILARVARYPAALKKRDEALAKLEAEREAATPVKVVPGSVAPIYKDVRFVAGIALGVIFFALGLTLQGYLRYVALLDIPAFGLSALLALKYVDDLQGTTHVSRKGDVLAQWEKRITDEFEIEAGPIKDAVAKARVESPKELVEQLSLAAQLAEKTRSLEAQLAALEQTPAYAEALAKVQTLRAEHTRVNATLTEKGAFVRDIREVEREMQKAKETLARARAPAAPVHTPSAPEPPSSYVDPFPSLLKLAADLFSADLPTTAAQLKDRCGQYVAALSDKRCVGVELDLEGRATAVMAGGKVRAPALAGADLDVLYLAMRLTLLEKLAPKLRCPVVLEDCFAGFPAPKLPLLGKMLKHLGTSTQVLHVTASPAWPQMADATASL